jgi:hypothetical protein
VLIWKNPLEPMPVLTVTFVAPARPETSPVLLSGRQNPCAYHAPLANQINRSNDSLLKTEDKLDYQASVRHRRLVCSTIPIRIENQLQGSQAPPEVHQEPPKRAANSWPPGQLGHGRRFPTKV